MIRRLRNHPDLDAINKALRDGLSTRKVADLFSTQQWPIDHTTLYHHKKKGKHLDGGGIEEVRGELLLDNSGPNLPLNPKPPPPGPNLTVKERLRKLDAIAAGMAQQLAEFDPSDPYQRADFIHLSSKVHDAEAKALALHLKGIEQGVLESERRDDHEWMRGILQLDPPGVEDE